MGISDHDEGADSVDENGSGARDAAEEILRRRSAEDDDSASFVAGDLVADRYRIDSLVGRGGMGRVWRAHDVELDQTIALKTLSRRRLRNDPGAEALKREVLMARRVAHRNACRVYDIVAVAEQDGQTVWGVAMEFLDGRSLADQIETDGPLESEEAVGIARQIAAGMAAAHELGITHRDLKPENIMLVAREDGIRAVIADFGLAEPGVAEDDENRLAGSPMTIAPEQVEGGAVGPAADVYAFGVVVFHALTGEWPFAGATPLAAALARLETSAPELPTDVFARAPELAALVTRCLARAPEDRPASGQALADELAVIAGAVPLVDSPAPGASWLNRVAGFAVLGGVAAFALSDGVGKLADSVPVGVAAPAASAGTSGPRPALAVVGFSGDDAQWDWVATALGDRFDAVLSAADDLRVVSPSQSRELAADLAGPRGAPTTRTSAVISSQTGVQWNLGGSYVVGSSRGGQPTVELSIELRGPRARVVSTTIEGSLDDLPSLAVEGSAWVRSALALESTEPEDIDSSLATLAESPDAVRLHAMGKRAMQRQDFREAQQHFEAALEIEPGNPVILLALAEAWSAMGLPVRAREAAEASLLGIERLDRARQLEVRGRHAIVTNQWDLAEQTYAALFEFYPDDLQYGLLLAEAQDRGARLEEALVTVERLRQLPEPARSDPRIDMMEAWVRFHQGDYQGALPVAKRAEAAARALGRRSIVARSLQLQAEAGAREYSHAEREALLTEAGDLFEAIGDAQGLTMVLLLRGDADFRRGDLSGAAEAQGRAVDEAERIGAKRTLARALTSLAITRDVMGQLEAGVALKERSLANYRERDVQQGAAITLENLGISLFKLGRMAESLQRFEEAAQEFARLGDLIGVAWAPYHQARIWRQLGEVRLARQEMGRALANAADRPEGGLQVYAEYELAWLDVAEDDLSRAVDEGRRLLDHFADAELEVDAAETEVMLAEIDNDRGATIQALEMADAALRRALETGSMYTVAGAETQRLHAALAAGEADLVDEACARLTELVPGIEYKVWELSGRSALAMCAESRGDRATARDELARVAEESARLGLVLPYAEAALLHARLLGRDGDFDAARSLLDPLAERAREGGWARTLRQISEVRAELDTAQAERP